MSLRATDLLALALALAAPPLAAAPARIVSMNPCADAILAELVPPARIAGLSHWSSDPAASSMDVGLARRLPRHFGSAEEVLALRPDLVIAGAHTPAATRAAFSRLGVPVVLVGVPSSVAESLAEIRRIATAVGQPGEGEALESRIEAALVAAQHPGPPARALLRTPAGVVPGAGTLVADVMARTGFVNAAAAMGLATWDILPLERLLLAPPAILLVDPKAARHPALVKAGPPPRLEPFPMRLLNCGGPTIIPLAGSLAEIRRLLP